MNIGADRRDGQAAPQGPGRPRGGRTDARERLLGEARRQFSELGYQHTTLRGVAQACGVDVALISYHFGTKRKLFAAAVEVPVGPADIVETAIQKGTIDAGLLLAGVIRVWEDPATGQPLRSLALAALQDSRQRLAMGEYLQRELVTALAGHLTGTHRERRARAATYLIAGTVLSHYILGLNPDSEPDTVFADLIGPLSAALYPVERARSTPRR